MQMFTFYLKTSFKNSLFTLMLFFLIPFTVDAEWVTVAGDGTKKEPPKVTIISDDASSTVIKIELSGFEISPLATDSKTYRKVDLLNETFVNKPGYPAVPYVARTLAIPDDAAVSVEVLESDQVQTFKNILLPPARESWYESESETPYLENTDAYRSSGVYPEMAVRSEDPVVFRDFRIARVSFFPVHYIAATHELQVVTSMTVRISYGRGEVINPKTTPHRPIPPSFAKLYRSFIFNYQQVLNRVYDGKEEGHDLMLCIMPDMFVESFQTYADWKRKSGTDIHITKFSDIGANANNPEIIKNHITDAYNNWEVPPTHVLIVGDDGIFPKKIVVYPDYSFPNEDYFVEIEGNDYFPEMMIGRFTNQGDYRMRVMINKFMLYEREPYIAETDWYKKGTCCSNNDFESQVTTKRFAAHKMLDYGNFTSVDTMMSDGSWGGYNCTYHLNDVISAINEGRSYLNYRGEGWSDGWHANCYQFSTGDVADLNNGRKFTFVTSIGCGVAMFDTWGGNCFGEAWVQLGTISNPRGGVAFVGPVSNTHTTYNNKIDKGIYVGMFQEGMDSPGEALIRGKLYMYNVYGNDFWVEYHYRIYCVLGDPSLHIWKDVPQIVNVDLPATIPEGNNEVDFTVTFQNGGDPVQNAQVCVTSDDIFATDFTDTTGKITLDITPENLDTLWVTVRGGNVYPWQGYIEVVQYQELVEPEGDPVIVDLDGNNDGLINPNENCDITFTLKNWGVQAVNNVQATLTTTTPDYVDIVTTSPVSFGNIDPGDAVTGDPFQFFVHPDCPVGQEISFQLHVTTTNSEWDYYYTTEVVGCELVYDRFLVKETSVNNVNFKIDPGETLQLFISIENIGQDVAPDVAGVLTTESPYVTIDDATATFGTVNIGEKAENTDDYFVISVDASCPTGIMIDYTLKLFTQNGLYPYETLPVISLPVSKDVPSYYTGPDEYGYFAYSSNDAFYDQTPVYDWMEISDQGTHIDISEISDYTETVDIPFTFQYYGTDYNQVRISTDGWLAFGSGTQTAPVNYALPHNDDVNNMVAPFWSDLNDTSVITGSIYYYHDNANHRFIIEWDSLTHNNFVNEPRREIFEVILLDPDYYTTESEDGEMIFQYKAAKEIDNITIGIENNTQDIGLQYLFNDDYDPTAMPLTDKQAIKITTEAPYGYIYVSVDDDKYQNENGGYSLHQNQPNPFSSQTLITYSIPETTGVSIEIYDITGQLIRTFIKGIQPAGNHSVTWNGTGNDGLQVESGLYFYRLKTDGFTETRKMFMIK